jgi:hypothetical protein
VSKAVAAWGVASRTLLTAEGLRLRRFARTVAAAGQTGTTRDG